MVYIYCIFSLGVAPLKPITHSKFAECIYNKIRFFIISYLHVYGHFYLTVAVRQKFKTAPNGLYICILVLNDLYFDTL